MIEFNSNSRQRSGALSVLRVAPSRPMRVVWQSEEGMRVGTHWVGRTVPCAGASCAVCQVQRPAVRAFGICTTDTAGGLPTGVLLELNSQSADLVFDLSAAAPGSRLSGAILELFRQKRRGPVTVRYVGSDGVVIPGLASVQRLASAVATLFGLPGPLPEERLDQWQSRVGSWISSKSEKWASML